MTVANAITLLRIALIPVFGYLWWRGLHAWALGVFALASLSDWLDGFFARLLDQKSRLGQILDPTADKLMVLVCFLVAAALGAVPRWLAVLVIGRDVILASGGALFAFVLRNRFEPRRWKPSRIGKYATFAQILTIGFSLAESISGASWLAPFAAAFAIQCALLTSISGLQYIAFGLRALTSARLTDGGTST
jgi:cardiolipin synthase